MKRQLATLFRLPAGEQLLLAKAWLSLLAADLALRALPLAGARRLLSPLRPRRLPPGEPVAVERLARLIEIAAGHHVHPMRCLPQALVLERWLRQRGLAATLQIGVRREGSRLAAHAWVEHAGGPVVTGRAEPAGAFAPLLGAG